jgi:hypothetical protein
MEGKDRRMMFTAKLNRASAVYRNWRGASRLRGRLADVEFRYTAQGDYITSTLTAHEVSVLTGLGDVVLCAFGTPAMARPTVLPDEPVSEPDEAPPVLTRPPVRQPPQPPQPAFKHHQQHQGRPRR